MPDLAGLPVAPGATSTIDQGDDYLRALRTWMQANLITWSEGTLAQRPVINAQNPGTGRRVFRDSSTNNLYIDAVSKWVLLINSTDERLTDGRTPIPHAASHAPGGSDSSWRSQETVNPNNALTYVAAQVPAGTAWEHFVRVSREADGTREHLWRIVLSWFGSPILHITDLGGFANTQIDAVFTTQLVTENGNRQLIIQGKTPGSGFPYRAQISSRRVL